MCVLLPVLILASTPVPDTSGPDRGGIRKVRCFDVRALLALKDRRNPSWSDRLAKRCASCARTSPPVFLPASAFGPSEEKQLLEIVRANFGPDSIRIAHDLLIVRHSPRMLARIEDYLMCVRSHR